MKGSFWLVLCLGSSHCTIANAKGHSQQSALIAATRLLSIGAEPSGSAVALNAQGTILLTAQHTVAACIASSCTTLTVRRLHSDMSLSRAPGPWQAYAHADSNLAVVARPGLNVAKYLGRSSEQKLDPAMGPFWCANFLTFDNPNPAERRKKEESLLAGLVAFPMQLPLLRSLPPHQAARLMLLPLQRLAQKIELEVDGGPAL